MSWSTSDDSRGSHPDKPPATPPVPQELTGLDGVSVTQGKHMEVQLLSSVS